MPDKLLDISAYRPQIESALAYSGGTHQYDDVAQMVAAGHANFWPGPASLAITETVQHPRQTILHYFLAAGNRRELRAMEPVIGAWAREQGCTKATLVGRKGWQRSFMVDLGWRVSDSIIMEKDL